jgi:hypothetical protein
VRVGYKYTMRTGLGWIRTRRARSKRGTVTARGSGTEEERRKKRSPGEKDKQKYIGTRTGSSAGRTGLLCFDLPLSPPGFCLPAPSRRSRSYSLLLFSYVYTLLERREIVSALDFIRNTYIHWLVTRPS